MDPTEDLSVRVLLKNVLTTEPPRTPITRSASKTSTIGTRRSSRVGNKDAVPRTPQEVLRRSLKHKMRESITRKSLPVNNWRTASVVLRRSNTTATTSMLFNDGDTPRHMLRNIMQTEPGRSPVVHERTASEEPQAYSANHSLTSKRPSIELSSLDLPDLTIANAASSVKGLSRKRPRRSLNVTALEKRLRNADADDNESSISDHSSLSLSSSTSLSLKTPYVDFGTEKKGLERKRSNRRKISEEEFGAAVNKRQMGAASSFVQVEQAEINDTAYSEGFTLGLSKLSEPDITTDILHCNTALYAQPDAMTSNFSIIATQDKATVMASQLQRQMEPDQEIFASPTEEGLVAEPQDQECFPQSEEDVDAAGVQTEEGKSTADGHLDNSALMSEHDVEESTAESRTSARDGAAETEEEENRMEAHFVAVDSQTEEEEGVDSQPEEDIAASSQEEEEEEEEEGQQDSQTEEEGVDSQPEEDIAASSQEEKVEEEEEGQQDSQTEEGVDSQPEEDVAASSQEEKEEEEGKQDSQTEEEEEGVDSQPEEDVAASSQEEEVEEEVEEEGQQDSQTEEEEEGVDSQPEEDVAASSQEVEVEEEVEEEGQQDSQTEEEGVDSQPEEDVAASSQEVEEEEEGQQDSQTEEEALEEGAEGPLLQSEGEEDVAVAQSDQEEPAVQEQEWEDDDNDDDDSEEIPSKTPAFVRERKKPFRPTLLSSPSVRKNIQASTSGGDGLPAAKPKPVRKRTGPATKEVGLPKSWLMGAFKHFAKTKVSADVYPVLKETMDQFFERMAEDLETYANHAKRNTIEVEDVILLLKRQGLVNDKVPVEVLIEKYLRLDQRQLLIPIATSGNVVFPKMRK